MTSVIATLLAFSLAATALRTRLVRARRLERQG